MGAEVTEPTRAPTPENPPHPRQRACSCGWLIPRYMKTELWRPRRSAARSCGAHSRLEADALVSRVQQAVGDERATMMGNGVGFIAPAA